MKRPKWCIVCLTETEMAPEPSLHHRHTNIKSRNMISTDDKQKSCFIRSLSFVNTRLTKLSVAQSRYIPETLVNSVITYICLFWLFFCVCVMLYSCCYRQLQQLH